MVNSVWLWLVFWLGFPINLLSFAEALLHCPLASFLPLGLCVFTSSEKLLDQVLPVLSFVLRVISRCASPDLHSAALISSSLAGEFPEDFEYPYSETTNTLHECAKSVAQCIVSFRRSPSHSHHQAALPLKFLLASANGVSGGCLSTAR